MEKTAMQIAIEKASHYANDCLPQTRERGLVLAIISVMKSLLPTERENIENGYNEGYNDGADMDNSRNLNYFNNKYKQ